MAAGGEGTFDTKRDHAPKTLSARDKSILDRFASGTTRKVLAEDHDLTAERIGQIINAPVSIAYLAQKAGNTKTLLFAKAGEELLARMDWGGIGIKDMVAIWRSAMPQEININLAVAEAARIVAERRGLTPEQTGLIVELASRRKAS